MADELILSISGEDRDLGDRNVPFAEHYTINCNQEVDITVTETLDSVIQIRSYTAQANTEQQAVIEMSGLSQGQHTLTITATADEVSVTRVLTFTLPITYLSPIDADLGDKGERFTIPYMAKTFSGAELQITEKLDGEIHREYTAVSGQPQEMTVNTEKLTDRQHTVEVIVTGDGETKSAKAVFRVAAINLSDGGTVQEMQDSSGDPVYPATIAKAVMMTDGKSVENAVKRKVGDIQITARTDLGDDWLLCNGVRVSREVYGALGGVIPLNLTDEWTLKSAWSSTKGCEINCITYADGYWVVGGKMASGSSSYAYIAYTTNLEGTWTTKSIWSGTSTDLINCIAYADGYWVVGGNSGKYAYATSLGGKWTTGTTLNSKYINCVIHADGYWVLGSEGGEIAYTTDPAGAWTIKQIRTNTGIKCITYADGYWVVGGDYALSSTYYPHIAHATSLTGSWSYVIPWDGSTDERQYVTGIIRANGYWVICGNSIRQYVVAYSTDLAGPWTKKTMWSSTSGGIHGIVYANGYWVACGRYYADSTSYAKIAYTDDLDKEWIIHDVWSGTSSDSVNCVTYRDNYFVAGGRYYNGTTYYARVASYDARNILLPTVSVDNAYVYIKAKE